MIEEYVKLLSEGYLHKSVRSFGHYGIAIDMKVMPNSSVAWIDTISNLYNKDAYCAMSLYKITEMNDSYTIGFIKKEDNGKYSTVFKALIPHVTLEQVRELLVFLEEHRLITNNSAMNDVV